MKVTKSLKKEIPMQMMEANVTINDPENLLSLIHLELIDEKFDRFVGLVEHAYQASIEREDLISLVSARNNLVTSQSNKEDHCKSNPPLKGTNIMDFPDPVLAIM
jgi:hypothetical protein